MDVSAAETGGGTVFGVRPGSNPEAITGDAILLRGEAAARARRIDLVSGVPAVPLEPVGEELLSETTVRERELEEACREARLQGFEQGLKTGLEQGKVEGLAEGVAEGHVVSGEEGSALANTIATVTERLEARIEDMGSQVAASTVDLALEIAEAVLARELAVVADPGAEAILRCLDLVPPLGSMVVRLNPDDAERLGQIPELGERELAVVADDTVVSGDAVVSVGQITVDAKISSSLQRVAEALHG